AAALEDEDAIGRLRENAPGGPEGVAVTAGIVGPPFDDIVRAGRPVASLSLCRLLRRQRGGADGESGCEHEYGNGLRHGPVLSGECAQCRRAQSPRTPYQRRQGTSSQLMSDRGLRDVYPRDARTGAKWAVSTRCLRDANGLSSLQELIAGPVDGDQVVGVVRFRLEQRPQPGDEVVDGPRERRVPVTPDVAQELL